ncbi:MAG: regulatory protein RecX [Candidatus Bipolaricaulaceae bacterium]
MRKPRDEAWAWRYLSRLLAVRPRTEAEVCRRLSEKGCPPQVVEATLRRARQAGLVDDALFARLYAEDRLSSRPRARRLVAHELRARGVEPATARRVAQSVLPECDDRELARRALRARLPLWQGLPREPVKRRAYAFLLRRGFPPAVAREAVEELVAGEG